MQLSAISVFALLPVVAFGATQHGEWTMGHSDVPGKVSFGVKYSNGPENHSDHSSDWSRSEFQGLDFTNPSKHDVHFEIDREAGTISFQGFMQGDEGAGLFGFSPHLQYSRTMAELGFEFSDNKLFAAALYDVNTKFAREIKTLEIAGLNADKLIAFQIFHLTPAFVRDIRATGVSGRDADKLIAFQIFKVSPDFVRAIEKLGFAHPEPDELIALRVQGVTSSYIEELQAHGVHDLTFDQVIALHTQGIN